MMKAIIFVAATLLILQIGLTVAVHQQQAVNLESTAPDSAFLSFTSESISSIRINGPENEELVLQKNDKGWIMPGAFSAPVSKRQVDDLLQKLTDARQGLAVATSKGAAKRFKTAEDDFERHVTLKQGDAVVGDFYLGTSAGMRNSHVRKADQDAVVSIPVGSHEVDVEADSWLDRTLADLNKDELKVVVLGDISLSKKEEGEEKIWLLNGATKEETEKEAVDKLLNKVTAISVQSVLDPATSAELLKDPAVQFTVTKQDDSQVTYAFAKNDDKKDNKEDDYFILKMSDNELYFKVGKWLVDDLTEAKREKLLVGYEEKKEDAPAVQTVVQPVTQSVAQEAPLVDEQVTLPEQGAVEQAVVPELPPEDEEALPVQEAVQEKGERVEAAESVEKAEPAEQEILESAEQNAGQEAVSEKLPEQEQIQEDVQQNPMNAPVDDSGVEESSEQKQEAVPAEEAAE